MVVPPAGLFPGLFALNWSEGAARVIGFFGLQKEGILLCNFRESYFTSPGRPWYFSCEHQGHSNIHLRYPNQWPFLRL